MLSPAALLRRSERRAERLNLTVSLANRQRGLRAFSKMEPGTARRQIEGTAFCRNKSCILRKEL